MTLFGNIPFAFHTITVLNPIETTDSGNAKVKTFVGVTPVVISGCHVQAGGTSETQTATGTEEITTQRLFAPDNDVISSNSRIVWGMDTYEVIGDPNVYPDPITGGVHHQEVMIQKVRG